MKKDTFDRKGRKRSQRQPMIPVVVEADFEVLPSLSTQQLPLKNSNQPLVTLRSPSPVPSKPLKRGAKRRRSLSPQSSRWQGIGVEFGTVIGVNLLLTVAAISGLVRLVPVQMTQNLRLQELNKQVDTLSQRVSRLQSGMDRSMDPLQQNALIKERSNYVLPTEIQVRLVDPDSTVQAERNVPGALPGDTTASR